MKNNLNKTPKVLDKVFNEKQVQARKGSTIKEKIKKHQIDLQKGYQLLIKAPNFDNKQAIIEIIERLNETPLNNTVDKI